MRIHFNLLSLVVLAAILIAGCAVAASPAASPAAPAEMVITATEYAYTAPDQVEAGLVTVTLENEGELAHHAQLVRLPAGMPPDELMALFQTDTPAALQAMTFVGGPGLLDPGLRQSVQLDLAPGGYLVLSFVFDPEGVPYLAKGMVKPFEVIAAQPAKASQPVEDNGEVRLLDFSFILPDEINAGKQVWQVINEGQELHEIMVVKLADGVSVTDAIHFLHKPDGSAPYANIGGFQAIGGDQTGWLELDLAPGEYVALCYVPGAETGDPHFAMGMVRPFSVK
ncbi:MAG: hypothetical protein KJZ93_01695 [Caldilineaceae bacterium]|nr:hypothetical protein [Caldilineaceae bacterium]